ncbi:kinesin-like protein KIF20B isoform X2 [Nasonia vitripennis]|uniref:Kinesin motor domain-containing protein n=1 Tax=Nasonia vitripennis TaxID=7425 RepID=A0A7M7HE70_NASVI|nr:kinesin-like protein KIF20B isoform X2 [Nasonia vitripennis]
MNFLISKLKMLSENEEDGDSETAEVPISTESLPIESSSKVQVFLRIRPTSQNEVEGLNDVYTVEDSSTLLVKHFSSNEAARRSRFTKSSDNATRKKFSFSKIFNLQVEQSQFFNEAIKPAVIDLLNNQSSTVLSYGTADAGKTYTLFGTVSQPGVIPRTIELIYSSLNCTLVPWFKPKRFRSIVNLDECDRSLEIDTREKLLSCRLSDKSLYENAYKSLEYSELNKNRELCKDSMYSVWISFVEMYNDVIYDLLEVDEEGKNVQLKLVTDKHGTTYIQGMRSVCATTGLEAYEILNAGQTRLSTVTESSYKSSRSHSIFTIKLLKYDKDCSPSEVKVSSLSFYDLAGTGRVQKSSNNDKQLKEFNSINKSLLALGRCLKVIVEGQLKQSAGPFRDSKLTRLVQRSLCGKENIILLINVNPTIDLLAETQSVFKFASMAMKLTSGLTKDEKKILEYHTPISSPKSQENCFSINTKTLSDQDIDDLIQKNKQLSTELKELKSTNQRKEFEVRKELTDYYKKQLDSMEEYLKKRTLLMEEEKQSFVKFSVDQVNHYYKDKLQDCTNRKRKRTDRGDYEERLDMEILETKNIKYSSKITSLEKTLLSVKRKLKILTETINNSRNMEPKIENAKKGDATIQLDGDLTLYLSTVQTYIEKSFEAKKAHVASVPIKSMFSTGIQCSSNCSDIGLFCKEIQKLLDANTVQLPEINDSLDSVDDDLQSLLPKVKELVISSISEKIKLEMENSEKLGQIQHLSDEIKKRDKDLFELKMQYQESESARMILLRQKNDIEAESKAKELFKNEDFVTIESENCFADEENYQILSTQQDFNSPSSLNNESRLSLYTSESEKIARRPTRSSSDSSQNDSGVASSIKCCGLTHEKSCQTNIFHDENTLKNKLEQLKLDYENMAAQHRQEAQKVAKLSQESEDIREAMEKHKKNLYVQEKVIAEYQNKNRLYQLEIERLNSEKSQLKIKHDEMIRNLGGTIKEYEKKITELQVKLEVHQKEEHRTVQRLENYLNKSVDLKSELSITRLELEKKSMACYKDHIIKIDQLEKDLNMKTLIEQKLGEKISQYEKDLARINDLTGKISNFENLMTKIEKERSDLHRMLDEKSNCQSEMEHRLKNLIAIIDKQDDKVHYLRTELGTFTKINSTNHRKAQELDKEVSRLMENITFMKEDIKQSEKARKALEQNSKKELENLRSRLTICEDNADLLNIIRNSSETKQDEVHKLKVQLSAKNKELEFFKKNRNATIQRYECLVRQLQEALNVNPPISKLKKIFPHKKKYLSGEEKEYSICEVHGSEPQIRDCKLFLDDEPVYLSPCPSLHAVMFSSTESSEMTASKDAPTRLAADVSEKCLEILY